MDFSINISGVQEGKKYLLEFSISQDGERINNSKMSNDSGKTPSAPSLEEIENDKPTLEEGKPVKKMSDFKVESSISGKIKPTR